MNSDFFLPFNTSAVGPEKIDKFERAMGRVKGAYLRPGNKKKRMKCVMSVQQTKS